MAMTKWGRKETIIWPPHSPIYTYGAVFMAVVLTGLFLYCRFSFGNSPLQRFYTPIYIRSSVAGAIGTSRQRQLPDAHGGRSRNSTASGDERRRDRRHDAGTGRQAHPACALAVRLAARLCSPLPGTGAELYRRVLECLSQECGLRWR